MIIAPLKLVIYTDSNKIINNNNKKRLTLWPQQTGALLQLISIIQNQAVIYEAIFKILFEYECGIFLAECYFNICFY